MARTVALIFGIIYLVVGLVGFIPGLGGTAGIAPTPLLGIFDINVVHNIVHILIGIVALMGARSEAQAGPALRGLGIVLIIIGIVGLFWKNPFNIIPIGGPDVALHLVTGVIFLWAGMSRPQPAGAS